MAKDREHRVRIRDAKRNRRIQRWDRPISGRLDTLKAWANMLVADHGIFRLFYLNRHAVGSGKLWRSAQPAPHQLKWFHRRGVKSVICLRGQREYGSWPLEKQTCADLGINFYELRIRSREAPDVADVLALKAMFDTVEYPALVHCKSGADRAGLAAALFLIFRENASASEAARQLSWRYGHVRSAKTGVLYRFIKSYTHRGKSDPMSFEDWVKSEYDPVKLTAENRSRRVSDIFVDQFIKRE